MLKMPFLHKKPVKNFLFFIAFFSKNFFAFPVIYTGYTFIVHLAARSYYVTSAYFLHSHQLLPRPSQNRAGAIHAHGSSTTHFTLKQTINSP
jgi:hypothetical protein